MPIREVGDNQTTLKSDVEGQKETGNINHANCGRCGGFLVQEWMVSLRNDGGDVEVLTSRCIQCGEIIDPVLLHNRSSSNVQGRRRGRAKPSKWGIGHSESP